METNCGTVLLVDDEPNALRVLAAILSGSGYEVVTASDVDSAIGPITQKNIDAVITDLKMPGKDGTQFYNFVAENRPDVPVIFLTAYGTVESAVSAMTSGAYYYFIKPPDYEKLRSILARAVEQRRLKREVEALKERLSKANETSMIGNSPGILKIFKTIEAVKDSSSSVLVCGETGTGKELVARALHYDSLRREKPFVAVNCASMPRDLIESELFGYEKGAFTGAVSRRIGRFEEASGGTIFLDEIGELEQALQAKLLRVLQEREIERLGSNKKIKVEFRLLSSTNRNLERAVKAKTFREDLFYRINVVQIWLPPLRERRDDISLLATEYVNRFCIREKKVLGISDNVMEVLQNHDWPGNVRQLRNVLERAVVLAKGAEITLKELPSELKSIRKRTDDTASGKTLREIQSGAVKEVLQKCKGNKTKTAKLLGISRKALYARLRDLGQS